MPIRVRIANGHLVPMQPLPQHLRDGMELDVDVPVEFSPNGHSAAQSSSRTEEDADWLTDEEAHVLPANLNEARRLGKEHMRRIMDIRK
jgi:hypothetical protein